MTAGPSHPARASAARQRDATLDRIAHARRWVIAGAAGLSAGLAGLAYALVPGHTLSSARAATSHTSAASTATMPPAAGPSSLGLGGSGATMPPGAPSATAAPSTAPPAAAPSATPPAAAPTPAQTSPPVVSGGS